MAGDPAAADELAATVAKHGLTISAFAVHGNPFLHPGLETAGTAHAEFEAAVLLAERLGVKTVITFSGCLGDCETEVSQLGGGCYGRKTTKRSAAGSGRKN